jgi:hypothetical protein
VLAFGVPFPLFAKTHQMFVPLFAVIHLVLEDSVGVVL